MKKNLLLLFSLTLSISLYSQIPNGSFEDWEVLTDDNNIVYNEPLGWDGGGPVFGDGDEDHYSCLPTEDVVDGTYALNLRCGSFGFEGDCRGWAKIRFALDEVPTSFSYHIKKNEFIDASITTRVKGFYQNAVVFDYFDNDADENLVGYELVVHDFSAYNSATIDSLEIEFRGSNTLGPTYAYGNFNVNIDALFLNDGCSNIGESCDDGNAQTINDTINADCECEGELTSNIIDSFSNNFDVQVINKQLYLSSKNSSITIESINIFNLNGQVIYTKNLDKDNFTSIIDLSFYGTNPIVLQLKTEKGELFTQKMFNN